MSDGVGVRDEAKTGETSNQGGVSKQGLTICLEPKRRPDTERPQPVALPKPRGVSLKVGKPQKPSSPPASVTGASPSPTKVSASSERISTPTPEKPVEGRHPNPELPAAKTDGEKVPPKKNPPMTIVTARRPRSGGSSAPAEPAAKPPESSPGANNAGVSPQKSVQPVVTAPRMVGARKTPQPAESPPVFSKFFPGTKPVPQKETPGTGQRGQVSKVVPEPGKSAPAPALPSPLPPPPGSDTPKSAEKKPSWTLLTQRQPESLQSLLEPEPEEVARLKQGLKQHRFMAQSVVLEESGLSNHVRSAMLAVSLVVIAFLVWASFSTIDEIASTQGQVMPSSPTQRIQHLEGGIIREILVQEGQVVKEDAVIVRLDSEAVLADLNQLNAKKASLQAQEIRIRSFLSGKEADFSAIPPVYQFFTLNQNRHLLAQRSALASERGVLETRISRSRSRVENLLDQQKNLEGQKAFYSQELAMKKEAYEQGIVSKLVFLGIQRDASRTDAELVRNGGDLTTARRELEEAVGDLDQLVEKSRESSLRELGSVTTDLAQTEEQSRRLADRVRRLEVRSPVWGVVNNLQVETVGGVIAPGALIAEIIPMDSTRRVETHISTRDIGHVAVGQTVTVKVTTYDFARYGGIGGILESISATTFKENDQKEPFFKGIVRLEKSFVGFNEKKNPVLPGMTVQADIDTGSKTLMEYMLKPIYASVNNAFRER